MSIEAWTVFAVFWVVFVTSPGPNAVNCISNGMVLGFWRAMPAVLAILTQSVVFMVLSAAGITALIAASPMVFWIAKLVGAGFLIWMGVRGWLRSASPAVAVVRPASGVYLNALAIATINPKSVAGYLAAFTQFVQVDVAIWSQMVVIMPTALIITTASYVSYTFAGAALGRAAMGVVFNVWVRRVLASCFIIYGLLLGASALPQPVGG
jgi:homoserine/homoserine lactone efflux protein